MIINFRFSNYKSYKNDNILLLTSNSKIRQLPNHVETVDGKLDILRFGFVFGNNASGKSNVLSAINFFRDMIAFPERVNNHFAFKGNENEPTKLEMVFSINEEIYQYGFSVLSTNNETTLKVIDEYLFSSGNSSHHSRYIYKKQDGLNLNINKSHQQNVIFEFNQSKYREINDLVSDRLFLNYINQPERRIANSELGDILFEVYSYFKNNIIIVDTDTYNMRYIEDIQTKIIEKETLKFDKGLESINLEKIETEEMINKVGKATYENILFDMGKFTTNHAILNYGKYDFIFASKTSEGIIFKQLVFRHKNLDRKFYFKDESEGTRRFIKLMSYFSSNATEATYIIDEVERSMHPKSIEFLFDFCEKEQFNTKSQYIFTSHNVDFMSSSLRKDEIFFSDKDINSVSSLYPLTDFCVRADANLKKDYLNGKFNKYSKEEVKI